MRKIAIAALLASIAAALATSSSRGATSTFANDQFINIRFAASGGATPYPSDIDVSGVRNPTSVTATYHGYGHLTPHSVAALLVAPSGKTVLLHSDVGGNDEFGTDESVEDLDITFSDSGGPLPVDGPLTSGTFRPTRHPDPNEYPNFFDAPAPPAPDNDSRKYGTTMAGLLDGAVNGTWKLFIDNYSNSQGDIEGGWSLTFTTGGGDQCEAPAPDEVRTAGRKKDCADWRVELSVAIDGIQTRPPPPPILRRTEIRWGAAFTFDKKPTGKKPALGSRGGFVFGMNDFIEINGQHLEHEIVFTANGLAKLKLGNFRTIKKFPIEILTDTYGYCTGLQGVVTVVDGPSPDADGMKFSGFPDEDDECTYAWLLNRTFSSAPGLTVDIEISDPVEIPEEPA